MSPLPKLLQSLKVKIRNLVELERELADLDRQIIAGDRRPTKKKKRSRCVVTGYAPQVGVSDAIRSMLRVMQEAREPLPPREIAARLGIKAVIVSQRLARAIKLGYVERVGKARYRVVDAVPSL